MTPPPEMVPLPPHACWHTPASNAVQSARTLHKAFVVVPAVEPKHAAKCCPDNLHDLTMDVFDDSRMNQFQSGLTARDTGTCVHS